jgi:hypothetical protein
MKGAPPSGQREEVEAMSTEKEESEDRKKPRREPVPVRTWAAFATVVLQLVIQLIQLIT